MSITKKQKYVYDFILEHFEEYDYSPTQAEIQAHFKLKSLGSVQDYLKYLRQAGYIEHDSHSARGITPLKNLSINLNPIESFQIPLLGEVAAGSPIEEVASNQVIEIPASLIVNSKDTFALKACGSSMINDGIHNGDFLIVKSQSTASNGDTVIASVDNAVTVKRFYHSTKGKVELRPANDQLVSQFYSSETVQIRGILTALVRKY